MLKKEQLSSSNQILIPSRKFLLLFNDTTVHKCHMVKRSSTIHKLDNAAALCRAHLHTIRGNRVYCLIDRPSSKETKSWACYTGRERRGKLLCAAVLKDTYSNDDDDDGILSMPRPDRLTRQSPAIRFEPTTQIVPDICQTIHDRSTSPTTTSGPLRFSHNRHSINKNETFSHARIPAPSSPSDLTFRGWQDYPTRSLSP